MLPLRPVIKDKIIRMNLPFEKLCGQCPDGASAMSSSKCGVAKRICGLEPRAVYTHCYQWPSLNLAAGNTLKRCKLIKDALETTRDITKLIKYSPRRDGIFQRDNASREHSWNQDSLSYKMDSSC